MNHPDPHADRSNASHPLPPANTGSPLLNWIADTSPPLVHLERRFDPFFARRSTPCCAIRSRG